MITEAFRSVNRKLNRIMAQMDDLRAIVERDSEVTTSAVALLQGLKAQLDDAIAAGDPAAFKELSARLGSNTQALADAVAANTPADTEPTEPPV